MESITFICRFCGSERKNGNSLRNHERLCKENPNRQKSALMKYDGRGHKGHNQFTKARELGLPVPESARKGKPGTFTGKHHSEETKKRISETQKKNVVEGRMFGYKLNHSSKVSYPEEYFMEVFKELPVEYNYQVGLYQLDFAIPERKVYVEIDGEQHYTDEKIIEHDRERTEKLNALGWNCLERVRWSNYKKLSEEEKEAYCKKLINNFKGHW